MGTVKRVLLVYPERRWVTPERLLTWHADAIANGQVPAQKHTEDWRRAAYDLEDIGHITLGKEWVSKQEQWAVGGFVVEG